MKSVFFAIVEIYTHIQLTLTRPGGEFDRPATLFPAILWFFQKCVFQRKGRFLVFDDC